MAISLARASRAHWLPILLVLALGAGIWGQSSHAGTNGASAPSGSSEGLRSLDAASRHIVDAPQSLWDDLRARRYEAAIPQLLALEARWAMDPLYNALLAEAALAAERYAVATLALERLVLLEPRNAGAWLDLAVASVALGDTETARRALDTLDRQFEVPPGIRLVMTSLRARVAAASASPDRLWLRAGLMFGRDSNANGGLAVNSLVLTPGLADIELPVDPQFLPRPSNLWLATVDASGRWETALGPIEGRLRLGEKRYVSEPDYDTSDVAATLAGRIGREGKAYWLAEWRRIDMGDGLLVVDIPRLSATRDLRMTYGGCQPSIGAELEGRRYHDLLGIYDARIFWLGAGARCPLWHGSLGMLVRAGDDNGPADRPGGDAARLELAAQWQGALAPRLTLSTGAILAYTWDADGYSPLIASGAARNVRRATVQGELSWRLHDRWYAVAWAEYTRQDSNIDLFDLRQTVVMAGLRYQSW